MNDLTRVTGSPFDSIRRVREDGSEYWTGRDLMSPMDYANWREFAEVIEKAKASLALVQGVEQAEHHLAKSTSDGGRWGNQKLDDYELTRFGAYLVAMAGDDTKRAVAEARIYFAVRTREAETAKPALHAVPDLSGLNAEGLEWLGQIGQALTATTTELAATRKQLKAAQRKVDYVDTYVQADQGACVLRVFANQVKVPEQKLRQYLIDRGVIYRTSFRRCRPLWTSRRSGRPV